MAHMPTSDESGHKSCTPQPFPLGPPSSEWFPEQLMAYVQVQHQVILDQERVLAINYWRLGKALEVLRKTFNHGQWGQFLKTSKIHKSKVSRARAIARAFAKEEDLAGLSVQRAYDQRPRKHLPPESAPPQDGPAEPARFASFLDHVNDLADPFVDDAGFADADKAMMLLPAVERVIEKFERIRRLLLEQAGKG